MNESKSEIDQALAHLRDATPGIWWALYSGCLEKGFNPEQALKLVMAWIEGSFKGGK